MTFIRGVLKKSILSACVVFGFLVIFELLLRIFQIAVPPAFVNPVEYGDKMNLTLNPDYGKRYFLYQPVKAEQFNSRTTSFQLIPNPKEKNVIRIVALGGSTTQGYPYNRRLAFPELMKTMLSLRHPDRQFEIINEGVVALNSFAALDYAKQSLKYLDPDAFLVYMGHNEFHGIFGSAAGNVLGSGIWIRTVQSLWRLHVYTLLEKITNRLIKRFIYTSTTGVPMQVLASEQNVKPNDESHYRAVSNLRYNIKSLIQAASGQNVPVVIVVPVSNLSDMPPLLSVQKTGTPYSDTHIIHVLEKLQNDGNFNQLRIYAEDMLIDNPYVAVYHYYRGRALLHQGDIKPAYDAFERALELDGIHFRACNDIIQTILSFGDFGNRLPGANIHIVDTRKAFVDVSKTGLPGLDLFYEHVHPNFAGNLILAWSSVKGIENVFNMKSDYPDFPDKIYMNHIYRFDIDRYRANDHIVRLLRDWPFAGRIEMSGLVRASDELRKEIWESMDTVNRLMVRSESFKNIKNKDPELYAELGLAYLREGKTRLALLYLSKSLDERPFETDLLSAIGAAYLKLGELKIALEILQQSIRFDPANAIARSNMGSAYLRQGKIDEAKKQYAAALRISPGLVDARKGLMIIDKGLED